MESLSKFSTEIVRKVQRQQRLRQLLKIDCLMPCQSLNSTKVEVSLTSGRVI